MDAERLKFTRVIAREVAAFMTDPEISLRILKQAGQTVALQPGSICAVVNREMHPPSKRARPA